MDFASNGAWVLVFDEVDMLAGERDRDDHGEMRRVVAAFLQTLEESRTENLVIATTNHSTALDKAIWRRFDEVALFKLPNKAQIQELLRVKLRRMKGRPNRETVARYLLGLSQAEVEMVCLDAMRAATLDSRSSLTTDDLVYSARERRRRLEEAGRSLS
jgi:SpoVK/Ycf46/Vps4 family AAA+-type ATPase